MPAVQSPETAVIASQTAAIAILAGGRGRRLGGSKPQAQLDGRPLLSHTLAAAIGTGIATIVIAKRDTQLPPLACETLYEPSTPSHPLLGIVTALGQFNGPVLSLGCDMPFLTPDLLNWLARLNGPAVVTLKDEPQPLLARWTPAQLPALEEALDAELSLQATIAGLPHELAPSRIDETALSPFGDPDTLCFNVNDPSDLARAEEMLLGDGAPLAGQRL